MKAGLTTSSYKTLVAHVIEESVFRAEERLRFWKNRLAAVEPCYFPELQETPGTSSLEFDTVPVVLDCSARIRAFCQENETTAFNLIQTAWGLVLRSYAGTETACFGYLVSGRERPIDGIAEAIGPCINMVVC